MLVLRTAILILTISSSFAVLGQYAGDPDLRFNVSDSGFYTGDGPSTFVRAAAVQSDGKVILSTNPGPRYNRTDVSRVFRLLPNGMIDTTFITSMYGDVDVILVQPDGKIVIGGSYTTLNGKSVRGIARLNPDGSTDNSFDVGYGISSSVRALALQPDGKLIVGGSYTFVNGVSAQSLARLKVDGSVDTSFSEASIFIGSVESIHILPNNKILVGGGFTKINGVDHGGIARLNANGTPDNSFVTGIGANDAVYAVCSDSLGNIFIGGDFTQYQGTGVNFLAKLDTTASLVSGSMSIYGTTGPVHSILPLSGGQLLIGGKFGQFQTTASRYIVRITNNGAVDPNFQSPLAPLSSGVVTELHQQGSGKYVIVGYYRKPQQWHQYFFHQLNHNGSVDLNFNPPGGANDEIAAIAVTSDNKILIAGDFSEFNGVSRNRVARLKPDGELDPGFNVGSGCNNHAYALAVQQDGKYLVGGKFTQYNGVTVNHLVRLNQDGSIDNSFNTGSGADDYVYAIEVQRDGKILIGGAFDNFDGTQSGRICRLNSDGSLDNSFSIGQGFNQLVLVIRQQKSGKILVGGSFDKWQGGSIGSLVRLDENGGLDVTYPTYHFNQTVRAIDFRSDGRMVVGCDYPVYVAVVDSNGNPDSGFINVKVRPDDKVRGVVVQNDDRFILSGDFEFIGSLKRRSIVRYNADGSLDSSFNAGIGTNRVMWTSKSLTFPLAMQYDTLVVFGGKFGEYNGVGRNRLVRIIADSSIASSVAIDEFDEALISVYPNPVRHTLRIETSLEVTGVRLYDLSAKSVLLDQVGNNEFDISDSPPGIYSLQIETTKGNFSTKIQKIR